MDEKGKYEDIDELKLIFGDLFYNESLKIEFEELLSRLGQYTLLYEPMSWEYVYGIKTKNNKYFKIYSSISMCNGRFRPYGKDAIRIVEWSKDYSIPMGKSKKVNRTDNWKSNIIKKIDEMSI